MAHASMVSATAFSLQLQHRHAADALMQAGFGADEAMREARVLMQLATGMDVTRQIMHAEKLLTQEEVAQLAQLVARRADCEPVAYLSGVKEFYGRDFAVSQATLIPRPDSEALVEAALALMPESVTGRILDLGTGTGCLLLTVLAERMNMHGVGVDLTAEAAGLAMHNANRLKLETRSQFYAGSWFSALPAVETAFDVILSNPPYISTSEMNELMPDVRDYEPHTALHGGEDGLDAYRMIIAQTDSWLVAGGVVLFEVGHTQAAAVAALGEEAGLIHRQTHTDLAGHARVVVLQKPGQHPYLSNDLR